MSPAVSYCTFAWPQNGGRWFDSMSILIKRLIQHWPGFFGLHMCEGLVGYLRLAASEDVQPFSWGYIGGHEIESGPREKISKWSGDGTHQSFVDKSWDHDDHHPWLWTTEVFPR